MTQTLEAVYENNMLKPLTPLQGLLEQQRVEVIVSVQAKKQSLRSLVGTLTQNEAQEMQRTIEEEFEC
ncbi:MAG: antitoxin family protein [Ignavibacteriales bacterium]|nr:antitoxin family protein [Ignavibacteriales bacterium]